MQIASRFTIAVHIVTCIAYFQNKASVTSNFLAESVGVNPVIIRNVMARLKEAGLIEISQGKSGITLPRPLDGITLYDVYKAVDSVDEAGLFHVHENPNPDCPVGRSIHHALGVRLRMVQDAMETELRRYTLADVAADMVQTIR